MSPFTPKGPWKTNPGLALLYLFGWYAVVVGAFVWLVHLVPDTPDPDCQDTFCWSPRAGVLFAGIFYGGPALLVALVISLVTLGVISARTPQTTAWWVGLIAAVPAFVLLAVALCVVAR